MYIVLTNKSGRCFYGQNNPIGIGPFLSAQDALKEADGDVSKVISIHPKAGITNRYYWRDIVVTEVY